MITETDIREYCFENNKALLDKDLTGQELQDHNKNVREYQERSRDELLRKIIKDSCEKADINIDFGKATRFAQRLWGIKYPTNLRKEALERLMLKGDIEDEQPL